MSNESAAPIAQFERVLASGLESIAEFAGAFEEWAAGAGVPPQVT